MRATAVAALDAQTACEAFQLTAADNADQVALRTPGGAVELTFADYAERVRSIAAGLHALGVRRGDTVGIMMLNRPEFNLCDSRRDAPRRDAVLDLQHLVPGADRLPVRKRRQPGRDHRDRSSSSRSRPRTCEGIEHTICVDGAPEGTIGLDELEAAEAPATSTSRRPGGRSSPRT